MNHYGDQAMKHWRTHLPTRFAQITDPETFFTDLGDRVQTEVEELTLQRTGDDPPLTPGEPASMLEKAARITAAKRMAEEQVLAELVLLPSEVDPELEPETDSERFPAVH